MKTNTSESFDAKLRFYTYQHFVQHARAPKVSQAAQALGVAESEARAGHQRVTEGHAIMLTEPNGEVWRVAPFSAVPTAFPARSSANSWFANCAWDALGIPAALHQDAVSNATCSCCNSEMPLEIKGGRILQTEGLIHIAVPARSWYEDVVFTLFQGCSKPLGTVPKLALKCTAKHSFWEGRIGYPRCGNSHEPEHVFASSRSVENKSPAT